MQRYLGFICDSARWDGFELRAGDVIVTTPPKCGTTWMQMCCLVLIHGPTLPKPLSELAPWLDQTVARVEAVHALFDAQEHRRVIKTHTPLDGVPLRPDVTYIGVGRDPRDVVLSSRDHMANMDIEATIQLKLAADLPIAVGAPPPPPPATQEEALLRWIDDDKPIEDFGMSLKFTVHHLSTVWERRHEPNVHLFHYSEMRADPAGQLARVAAILGIDVAAEDMAACLAATSFDAMRSQSEIAAPNAVHKMWRDSAQFFASGRTGAWRDVFSPAVIERYDERLAELCPDEELRAWLHTTA